MTGLCDIDPLTVFWHVLDAVAFTAQKFLLGLLTFFPSTCLQPFFAKLLNRLLLSLSFFCDFSWAVWNFSSTQIRLETGDEIVSNSLQWLHRSLVQLHDYTSNAIINRKI